MTWQLVLQIYLLSCIPALFWATMITYEDCMCLLGYKKPCNKFGYNWTFQISQSISMMLLSALILPIINIVVILWMGYGICISFIQKIRR